MSASPPGRRSAGRSTAFTFATNILVAVISLGNVLIIARSLGPEGRGGVAFLTTMAFLTSQICSLGVHQANANIVAKDHGRTGVVAVNSLVLALATSLVGILAVVTLVALVPAAGAGSSALERAVALGSVPLLVLGAGLQQVAVAHYAMGVANLSWALGPVFTLVINLVLALTGEVTVVAAVGAWVAGQLVSQAILAVFVLRRARGTFRYDGPLAREQLSFGVRAHLPRLLTLSNYRLDQWLMGALTTNQQLGLYSVAVAWAEVLFFLPASVQLVSRPDLVRADRAEAARQTAANVRLTLTLTVLLTLGMVLAAPLLCTVIFGPEFAGSVAQLRVLALGACGVVALKLVGNALTAQGRPLRETIGVAAAFVIIVVLDVLLIPGFGGLGAALASTIGYSIGGLVLVWVGRRSIGLSPADLVPRPSDLGVLVTHVRSLVPGRA